MKRYPLSVGLALLWTIAMAATPLTAQRVLYVATNAAGVGSGGSWVDAHTDLQPALAAAVSGDEIWVHAGAYYPGPAGSRTATFQLKTGVQLYGGFAGGETSRAQRDPARNQTILSGDLSRNDAAGFVNYTENSYHVVTGSGVDGTAVLDGFTIQAGNASGATSANYSAAGLRIDHGNPTIANCVIRANLGKVAGGSLFTLASPLLTNCIFVNNLAQSTFARGGAVYCLSASAPRFVGCVFTNNRATGGASAIDGGAVFLDTGCPASFVGCTFAFNTSATTPPNAATGGAITSLAGGMIVDGCAFWNSSSGSGGAVWNGGANCVIANCAFGENVATMSGGAILNFASAASLTGCTLARNFANDAGGVLNELNSVVQTTDSILWANFGTNAVTALNSQIRNISNATNSIAYSCVQGLFDQQPGEPPPTPQTFPGCIDADPMFVDLAALKLSLLLGSPCIDAGQNSALNGTSMDLAKNPRFIDEHLTSDTGDGIAPIADIGAYEHQGDLVEQLSPLTPGWESVGGVKSLSLTWTMASILTNATVTVEVSPQVAPADWMPATGIVFTTIRADAATVTLKATTPASLQASVFYRLKLNLP